MEDSEQSLTLDSNMSEEDFVAALKERGPSVKTPDELSGMRSTLSMMQVEMERIAAQIDVMEAYVKEMHTTFKKMEPMIKKYSDKPRFRIKGGME